MLGGRWRRLLGPWLRVDVSECSVRSHWELLSEPCNPSDPSRCFEVLGGEAVLGY